MSKWLKYVKPYWHFFVLGPLCMILEVVGEVLMPRFLAQVIDGAQSDLGVSITSMIMMILTALLMMAGGIGGAYFGAKAAINFASDLRKDVFSQIQTFSFANIDKFRTGSLVTRLTNDVTQLQNFVNMLLRMALRSPGMLIGGLIMAITMQPSLSLVFAVTIPMLLITIAILIGLAFPRFAAMQKRVDGLNATVQENITNIRVVKSFVREDFESEKFAGANANLKAAGMHATKLMIAIMPLMNFFMYSTIIAVVFFGSGIVLDGEMQIGDLSAFVTYVNQILSSLMMVAMLFMNTSRALASGKRIGEVLDERSDISDENSEYPELEVKEGAISFRNVSFRYYKDTEDPVLDKIDLEIPARSTVGIIGSTGCGKTTLVSLIPRLYDADEGEVLIDGVNVKDYSLYNLREGVGMVLQKNVLFSGTVYENLRFGDPDASDEEVKRFAGYAAADKFVSAFKNGYDSEIEQGGANVSGGQKQRLCIARALLKRPKVLILDDSTSAVDTATERQIQYALSTELKDCTKIIIAQRINSVKDADMIVVMDDGRITDVGRHEELLECSETYREIYESQASMASSAIEEVRG
ncbi:MAG: ABC transporter ATP-binding protein [Clostridia bacterium]|nr:ABC transporter ATP-binding protein [Clostridia bacterium]